VVVRTGRCRATARPRLIGDQESAQGPPGMPPPLVLSRLPAAYSPAT
jgi:hypothetical protein